MAVLLAQSALVRPAATRRAAVKARAASRVAARAAGFAGRSSSLAARPAARRSAAPLAARAEDKTIDVQEILTETAQKVGEAWEETEDKPAVVTLLGFGFVGLWATAGILKGIEALPLVPTLFELIGIAFSAWFVYRYLLFKPDRDELKRTLSDLKSKVLQ